MGLCLCLGSRRASRGHAAAGVQGPCGCSRILRLDRVLRGRPSWRCLGKLALDRERRRGARRSPARSVCLSRSTLSPKREASSRAFKRATTIGSRTASSSAPRSTRRSRPFPIAPASRSAAARRSLRRSLAQKAMARRCCPSAPCEVASATRPEIGSSMRPADWPGPTTGPCSPNWAMVRPIGASCGDSVGRPEPASRSLSRRTGRRRSNICSPTTAAAVSAFQASGSGSMPICSCTSCARG